MSGQYDVVVVGAGLSGILTTAQLLKKSPSLKNKFTLSMI